MSRRFPKRMRLRKRREYLSAQNHRDRRKHHGRHFLVIVAPRFAGTRSSSRREVASEAVGGEVLGEGREGRVGITVSKKVGNAVVRNRIKRLVREFVRQRPAWLPAGRDVVVIAKHSASSIAGLADVDRDLGRLEQRMAEC